MLELGGKNPTIVHSSANLKVAARRIAYGRYLNAGHICTAPDHVLVWPEVKDEFVRAQGSDPPILRRRSKAEPGLRAGVNRSNFDRLVGCSAAGRAVGGETDADELYIAPTVLVMSR